MPFVIYFRIDKWTESMLSIRSMSLEVVTTFKYLGLYFFKNGNWHRTQKCIANHAPYALHNLFSVFNNVEISVTQKCNLFDALVDSVLNYSSEILGITRLKIYSWFTQNFAEKSYVLDSLQT